MKPEIGGIAIGTQLDGFQVHAEGTLGRHQPRQSFVKELLR
jgi:hypothetical protein